MHPYPAVESHPSLPDLESEVLGFWRDDDTFAASLSARAGAREYVVYDGPPFANGLPHYGHLLTGFVKDALPRYHTMRGELVDRVFGWDCHGLPVEMSAQSDLGLAGRAAVERFGVGRFTGHCRADVQRYTRAWEQTVSRQARWVDFAGGYRTMDTGYTQSVMWAFAELWRRGLLYQGHKVLPFCWECETPLSNFETRLDDAYRERVDPALTVRFRIDDGTTMLAWTTTPWTLPSNLALAVGPDVDYAVVELDGERLVLAAAALERYPQLRDARRAGSVRGAQLAGRAYTPPFGWFAGTPGAFRVLPAGFVTTTEGTGVVHCAPGFGEDDQRLCELAGVALVCPVDDRGRFTSEVAAYEGVNVFDANPMVERDLGDAVFAREDHAHSYPHCWRTDTPLMYRAVSSWFVRVSALRERMLELNEQVRWVPEHVGRAFANGLASAPDWPVSRNRFWGAPVPVWTSDDPAYPRTDVYGSLDELERDFGVRPADLHRPWVDELTRPNPDDPSGRATMRRVPEVLDCWFESGAMPFAQVRYPFERRDWFESHFPADFVVEYVGQTRGWFSTMHVLSTALFDRPAFRTCLAHGVLLGADGRKLSKRLRNFPDPQDVFDRHGADAMRWHLLSSPAMRAQDTVVAEDGFAGAARAALLPVWSAWRLFATYANADGAAGRRRTDSPDVLDRFALASLRALVDAVTDAMESCDLPRACGAVEQFVDAFNNWYLRRSRDRFWRGDAAARDTTWTVLETLCRVLAPLAPMLAEAVWRPLTGGRSVHLATWPSPHDLPHDPHVLAAMRRVREVCAAAHAVREAGGLRVRQPLSSLTVASPWAPAMDAFAALMAGEVNVHNVLLTDDVDSLARRAVSVDWAAAGPRLGAATRRVAAAVRVGDVEVLADDSVVAAGVRLEPAECRVALEPLDARTTRVAGDAVVALDVDVTPDLESEGLARDVVRLVQRARRDAGLHVGDRVELTVDAGGDVRDAVRAHEAYVREQTLAVSVRFGRVDGLPRWVAGGRTVRVAVRRVAQR